MLHKVIIPAERHGIPSWIVADPAALAALTPTVADVGKVAVQLAPYDVFILQEEVGPTWVSLVNPASVAASDITVVDAGGFFVGADVEAVLQEVGTDIADLQSGLLVAERQHIGIACSDETTALTTGTDKAVFHMPYNFTLEEVIAGLTTPQGAGTIFTVDINQNGATILSTKLTVDNTEQTSITAATPAVISVSALSKGDKISIDIDQIGDNTAKGLKVYLVGRQP